MNIKDISTLIEALTAIKAETKPTRRSPKQNLAKAPPHRGRNTGRAQGLIGMTTMVPKRVYKSVVEHCREEEITISYYLRTLIDADRGTDMTDVAGRKGGKVPVRKRSARYEAKPRPNTPKPGKKRSGPKPKHSDEEIREYIALFHKENPKASAQQIFEHLRKEYGMKFEHNRAMAILKTVRTESLNGKSP